MRQFILWSLLWVSLTNSWAQAPSDAKILAYIDHSWNMLSRSMNQCSSVADSKVATVPILYLPAGMAVPPGVATMQHQCKVDVEHLPRKIMHMGDLATAEIARPGLLYLPHTYVVPGGRFNEMYGWDSYFIILGLVDDHRDDLARGIVENFFFEIENYGAILNANRTYYLTRSQPPLLSSMIRSVYESEKRADPAASKRWLARAYGYAQLDYKLWTQPPHLAGNTGLARYDDLGSGPVPEMADDSSYYIDVIRWLVTHPDVKTDYLVPDPVASHEKLTPEEIKSLAKTSCNVDESKVCELAHFGGYRLSRNFYRGDRAMRESGFDTSFRFGPFSGSTQDYAPVCLNSLLYKYERDMADFATILGRKAETAEWLQRANVRKAAMNRYLWNAKQGLYYDYDFVTKKQSAYAYITAYYPLWAGLASQSQAVATEKHLALFEHDGGMAMSDNESGMQWDLPYGWAPTNWFAVKGLVRYSYKKDAQRISKEFTQTVYQNFLRDGTIREKYNVVTGSANIAVSAGYKSNVIGFGWTNGVYLEMHHLLVQTSVGTARGCCVN